MVEYKKTIFEAIENHMAFKMGLLSTILSFKKGFDLKISSHVFNFVIQFNQEDSPGFACHFYKMYLTLKVMVSYLSIHSPHLK